MRMLRGSLRWGAWALLGCVLLGTHVSGARADDGRDQEPLATQIFDVAGLTGGHPWFIGECPPPVASHDVSDEENPLFGTEGEEYTYPVGQVDELIELVYGHVDPRAWEDTRGAMIRAQSERYIVAKHRPEVLAKVASYLAQLERRILQTITIEIRAVRAGVDRAPGGPRADEPSVGLTINALRGQRVSGFQGSRYAYVESYYTNVAQSATSVDPIVSVANLGLGVDAMVVAAGENNRLAAELQVHLSRLGAARGVGGGSGTRIEAPSFDVLRCSANIEAEPGVWTALSGAEGEAGWRLFARLTSQANPFPASTRKPLVMPSSAPGRTIAPAMMDISDLGMPITSRQSEPRGPWPSHYTPPEPPELPEPAPTFAPDAFPELLRAGSPVEVWEDPASMEVRNGRLMVRHNAETIRGIRTMLGDLRSRLLWSMTTRVDVVELPTAALEAWRASGKGAVELTKEQLAQLEAWLRAGTARRLSRLELPGRPSVANDVRAGRDISYLQDFDAKVAENATVPVPVVGRLFSGQYLSVRPDILSGGTHAVLDVRFHRTKQDAKAMREAQTPAGTVELPNMATFRLRSSLVARFGATLLFGSEGDEDHTRVVLLTPTLRRSK